MRYANVPWGRTSHIAVAHQRECNSQALFESTFSHPKPLPIYVTIGNSLLGYPSIVWSFVMLCAPEFSEALIL